MGVPKAGEHRPADAREVAAPLLRVQAEPARCACDPGPEGQHRYWCDTREGEASLFAPVQIDRDALAQILVTFGADVRLDNAEPAVLLGRAMDAVLALLSPEGGS